MLTYEGVEGMDGNVSGVTASRQHTAFDTTCKCVFLLYDAGDGTEELTRRIGDTGGAVLGFRWLGTAVTLLFIRLDTAERARPFRR